MDVRNSCICGRVKKMRQEKVSKGQLIHLMLNLKRFYS